jgi:2C-methyl-D-erythritol 2,4-cyclodiphosphate synthase
MAILSLRSVPAVLSATFAFTSIGLMTPSPSRSFETAGLADSLGGATVSVLGKLGYDCKNASAVGIVCKKCKMEDNKQNCEAYLCDAVTKKCRKKSAEIPNVPGLGGNDEDSNSDGIKLPSL